MNKESFTKLIRDIYNEVSTTGGSAGFSPGTGAQYATPKAFSKKENKPKYYYKIGYKSVPKNIKGSGVETKRLFQEDQDVADEFHKRRIKGFDEVEEKMNDIYRQLSKAKNDTIEYYKTNPSSFDVLYSTDIILSILKDIENLLNLQK